MHYLTNLQAIGWSLGLTFFFTLVMSSVSKHYLRLPVPSRLNEVEQRYPHKYRILCIACAKIALLSSIFGLIALFVVALMFKDISGRDWLMTWATICGLGMLAYFGVGLTCFCPNCGNHVLVKWTQKAPFKNLAHEERIVFTKRFHCIYCGQSYVV